MDMLSELEQLKAINATQDFLLSEPVDISKYLDEDGECSIGSRNLLQTNRYSKERETEFQTKLDKIPLGP